jgi:hypothetical protein
MLEQKRWMDRHLANIGFIMFCIGMVLLTLGTIAVLIEQVTNNTQWGFSNDAWGFFKGIVWVSSLHYGLGSALAWIGAVFYCLGRFLELSHVTIVGFGQADPSELIVKGPDKDHVVWIGKPYKNEIDAEAAANAFSARIGRADSATHR